MNEEKRVLKSYWIDSNLLDAFNDFVYMNKQKKSDVINDAISNYIITNKASINEMIFNEDLKKDNMENE